MSLQLISNHFDINLERSVHGESTYMSGEKHKSTFGCCGSDERVVHRSTRYSEARERYNERIGARRCQALDEREIRADQPHDRFRRSTSRWRQTREYRECFECAMTRQTQTAVTNGTQGGIVAFMSLDDDGNCHTRVRKSVHATTFDQHPLTPTRLHQ